MRRGMDHERVDCRRPLHSYNALRNAQSSMQTHSTAESLAASLESDAFYAFVAAAVPDEASRRVALVAYFAAALVEGSAAGRVVAEPHGAAIWSLNGESPAQAAAAAVRRESIRSALGDAGLARFDAAVAGMSEAAAARPALASAWYLSILGVAPHAQRTGVGRRLLAPTLREADALGMPCWLETFGEETLPFYASIGFLPIEDARVEEANVGAPYWILFRAPQAQ
jgi:GNAT superfamily N-acetyltransferase